MDIEEITIEDEYDDDGSDDGVNDFDFLNNSTSTQPSSRKNLIDQNDKKKNSAINFNSFRYSINLIRISYHFQIKKKHQKQFFFFDFFASSIVK